MKDDAAPSNDQASEGDGPAKKGPLNERESTSRATEGESDEQPARPTRRKDSTVSTTAAPGWLVTSCDVGTAEPQSLSEELERLQVLKSYHIMDPERDESIDRLTRMASLVMDTPYTFFSFVDMGRIWFRCNPGSDCSKIYSRDMLSSLARVIMKHNTVFDVPDTSTDEMFQKSSGDNASTATTANSTTTNSNSNPRFRFFAGAPLVSPEGYRLGAFCVLGIEPRPQGLTDVEKDNLTDFAQLMVKGMVDRRKLTTQGSPSHLVACTAHDLITPLTGIQLSLSLLQQDGDFQEKLGRKRKEYTSAAVRSSNMMLRICQSTIETLRGNRKIPSSASDWSLPRNIMHLAEASPFIDMKEFTANLEAISNSIPKQVPLTIALDSAAPTNIVSDGLKIFRSALNLLSNACTRANSGFIALTIYDDDDGSLVFECEDTGKNVEAKEAQSLFSQDIDTSNFGLYSVAYQINWLGGKYGVRKRDPIEASASSSSYSKEDEPPVALVNGIGSSKASAVATDGGTATTSAKKSSDKEHDDKKSDEDLTGAIFWFSIPIVLQQDVSELMGLAKTLSDRGDMVGIPTFKADLPTTPPASPVIEERTDEDGVTFFTTVPAAEGDVANKQVETTRSLNALIIEDSTTVRKILGRALSKLGYQVFEAVDGMEGLRELKATMFDMVLCDFLMPVMDGLDCVQQYREWEVKHRRFFKQYIVGISAHASRNDIERGLKLGMDDFKPKPIVLKTLTGLHDSANLKAVRASLDKLLNLPSLDAKRQHQQESGSKPGEGHVVGENGSKAGRFTLPKEKKSPRKTHFSIPVASVGESANSKEVFVVPRNPIAPEDTLDNGDGKQPALFSIPDFGGKKDEPKGSPLFSIGGPRSSPTGTEEPNPAIKQSALFSSSVSTYSSSGAASKKGRDGAEKQADAKTGALFSNASKSGAEKQSDAKPGALFSIASNSGSALFSISSNSATSKPAGAKSNALFSISSSSGSSKAEDGKKSSLKQSPLFSIPKSAGTADTTTSGAIKGPLFSIPINPTTTDQKPAPLFSIPASHNNTDVTNKSGPLFSIPARPSKAQENQNHHQADAKKPAALFSLTPPESQSEGTEKTESKKRPLFSIPNHVDDKNQGSSKKPAALFNISAKKPALFSIPVNPTAEDGGNYDGNQKAPLFSMAANQSNSASMDEPRITLIDIPKNTGDSVENQVSRPALFNIPGKSGRREKSE